ncbi:MAG: ABC transporter permease subunit [Candidatus Sericytochromatia bacterium]|nr:ABC transporter permease subunit [Candidatus Tanganyikabacteria bacterium]
MRRVLTLLRKEWLDLWRNPRLFLGVLVVPLLIAAVMIPALTLTMGGMESALKEYVAQNRVARKAPPVAKPKPPAEADLPLPGLDRRLRSEPPKRQALWYTVTMMMGYLFIFPIALPLSLGAASIIGEKQEGTLEPLLATPIRTGELLAAKTLFAAMPGILVTWAAYLVQLFSAGTVLPRDKVLMIFASPPWLAALFLLTPVLAFMTTLGLVMVSAWVTDQRSAQQLGALLVLPVTGAVLTVMLGLVQLETLLVLAIPPAALACLVLLQLAVRVFHRDTILTRWR